MLPSLYYVTDIPIRKVFLREVIMKRIYEVLIQKYQEVIFFIWEGR